MWECNYGNEPIDIKLLVLRLTKKIWIVILAGLLGALLVGGPYYLKKVTFGPAKEYQAVTDFYIDYALQENGEPHTYFNQNTWTQLIGDDVFTDKILHHMKAESMTKEGLRESLYATMLSDTRIVTTTVTTNDPELTMEINRALLLAMEEFGTEQKEIAGVRILQNPTKAELVKADVRTFRACMLGIVIFVFVTLLWMLISFITDDSVYVPITFERRYHVPMLGTINSEAMLALFHKLSCEKSNLLVLDDAVDMKQVAETMKEKTGMEFETISLTQVMESMAQGKSVKETEKPVIFIVKAAGHNGRAIEEALSFCAKCHIEVKAALLWDADEKLVRLYGGKC